MLEWTWARKQFDNMLGAQIARVAATHERFLASDGTQDTSNATWVDWQRAMADEMWMRREYFDAYGEMYSDV